LIFIPTGSLPSSNRHIEPELLKVVQQYSVLDELSEKYDNEQQHLSTCLQYISAKKSVGSLAANDDFNLMEYSKFLAMSKDVKDKAGVGSEPFPGEFLKPIRDAKLLPEVSELLAKYYENVYDYSFTILSKVHVSSENSIVVLPQVKQYGRLRIGAEVFGSKLSSRHIKSANVLAQFVTDDEGSIDTYPGQVQFFFEHTINLPNSPGVKHSLAFVKWYRPAEDTRSRFHCQVGIDDTSICNVELWKKDFYELSRDCIIPVHNILGRFVAGSMKIGKKNPKEYLSIVPLNKKVHI
jgi:hypothetical protein